MSLAGKSQTTSGPMIIIAAPSGAGKSSFVERICREMPVLADTVTYTTRAMRAGESEGHPYHFVSREDFERKIAEGFFVEWAHVHTNMYGTPLHQLIDAWREQRVVIMDVDVQGAATFKAKYPNSRSVFILPPSIEELRRRVTKRDGGPPRDLDVRMKNAEREIALASGFDYQIVNDAFDASYARFKKLVESIVQGG